MSKYFACAGADGVIQQTAFGPDILTAEIMRKRWPRVAEVPGDGDYQSGNWINADQELVMKTALPLTFSALAVPADGSTLLTVTGIPATTRLTLTGPLTVPRTIVDLTEDILELTFDVVGRYTLLFEAPYFVKQTVDIDAT